jgi:transcriptional regulator with XRE-family HTH domain
VRSLRLYREAAGLTQTELARRLGVYQPQIARYEMGLHRPRQQRMEKLAQAVGHRRGA